MIEQVFDTKKAADEIAFIEKHCFSTPWSAEQIKSSNDSTVFFIAKESGEAVGYAGMYTVLDEGYVTNIGVLPNHRKKGIGKALTQRLIDYSISQKLSFLSLEVRVSNSVAIGLYTTLGFKEVGKRKNFYSNPKEDALIMTRYFKDEF